MKKFMMIVIAVILLGVLAGCKNNPTGPTPGCAACAQETETAVANTTATPTSVTSINTPTVTQTSTSGTGATATFTATATQTSTTIVGASPTATKTPVVNIWSFTLAGTKAETVCVDYQSNEFSTLTGCSKTADLNSGNGYVAPSLDTSVNAGYHFDVWIHNTSGETLFMQLYVNGQPYGGPVTVINGCDNGHLY